MTDTTVDTGAPPLPGVNFVIDIKPPRDSDIPSEQRTRWTRWVHLLLTTVAIFGLPMLLTFLLGSIFNDSFRNLLVLGGFVGGGLIYAYVAPRWLFVYNPAWNAHVTDNPIGGDMIPYGPGLNPSLLWEQRSPDRNVPLSLITLLFELTVQSRTAQVKVTGTFQFRVDPEHLKNFVGVDDPTTIDKGLLAYVKSFITSRIAGIEADKALQNIEEFNRDLATNFMGYKPTVVAPGGTFTPVEFEIKYGIIVVNLIIDGLALAETAQETRDAVDEAKILHRVVAGLLGMEPEALAKQIADGTFPYSQYEKVLNRAMAISNNAKLDVTVVEGDVGALAAKLFTQFGGKQNNQGGK